MRRNTLYRLVIFLFTILGLEAGELHLTLEQLSDDGKTGRIETAEIEPGVSGFVVHHFTPEHSTIVAGAVVASYENGEAVVSLTPYTGLRHNALPKGEWTPAPGDEVILAFAYHRALLLAPTLELYRTITKKIAGVEWVHPDTFATFLSYQGHPTPLKEDIRDFCTISTAGLLYLYLDDSLFTVDCQSMTLLQITQADYPYSDPVLPFYSRVEEIDANWFGEGSSYLETYEPHYFELLAKNNPHSQKLFDYIQSHHSVDRRLLDDFELKSTP